MTTVPMDPRLQARRVELLRRQGRRRLRVVVVLAIATALAVALWWVLLKSPLLTVDAVVVAGAERTDPAAVVTAAGIREGKPLLKVDTQAAEQAVAALPWVDTVVSHRGLGGDVTFTIVEREPVAAVPGAEGWLLVDADGRVLDQLDAVPPDVVAVEGIRWQASPGGWIGERALPALEVAVLLPEGLRSRVGAIHQRDGELQLTLTEGGRVVLGDAGELDQKFLAALTMLVRADLACLDTIDVRAPAVPVLTRLAECS